MKVLTIIFFVLFFYNVSASYSDDKIAFIDLDNVIKNSNPGNELIKNIEKLNNKNLKILEQKQNELKKFEDEINSKRNVVSKEEILKDLEKLKEKVTIFNNEKNKMIADLNAFKQDELEKLMDKINPIIQSYMKKNSIEILLDSKYIYIGSKNSDLTQIITDKINKTN